MSTINTAFSRALQRLAKPSALLAIGMLAAGATLGADANAASFKCTNKMSASEKIVCNDPALSALDDRLAASWKHAKETTLDATALEAARTQQWLWRQHNCTDQSCVKGWYDRRIAELDADYVQAKQARHDAFEASLAAQELAPSAADAVRKMKDSPEAVAAAETSTTTVATVAPAKTAVVAEAAKSATPAKSPATAAPVKPAAPAKSAATAASAKPATPAKSVTTATTASAQ